MNRLLRRLVPVLALAVAFSCSSYEKLDLADPVPVATLSAPPPGKPRAERVVIISIDGLRPDAIEAAGAETLKKLIERGASCARAETIRPSLTLPSHTSMLTGLDYGRHHVGWNTFRSGYIVHPTVFSVAAQAGKKSAMIFSKEKFHFLANPNCVSWIYGPPTPAKVPAAEDDCEVEELKRSLKNDASAAPATRGDATTTADMIGRAFAAAWPVQQWPLTFVHFREADEAGHRRGWMAPEYIEAVQRIDQAISIIVAAIENAGGFEKTALIVSADHGGSDRSHYRWTNPDKAENVTIPWICVGPGIRAGLKIERQIRTTDTAPTALALIGLGAPEGIDGQVVLEVLK
jgi:arylsulfatase A-like enzyme